MVVGCHGEPTLRGSTVTGKLEIPAPKPQKHDGRAATIGIKSFLEEIDQLLEYSGVAKNARGVFIALFFLPSRRMASIDCRARVRQAIAPKLTSCSSRDQPTLSLLPDFS